MTERASLVFCFGELLGICADGSLEQRESLLVYLARILSLQAFDRCTVYSDSEYFTGKPADTFSVQTYTESQYSALRLDAFDAISRWEAELMSPENLEKIYSFAAYHAQSVRTIINNLIEGRPIEGYDSFNSVDIVPPDLVMPHDETFGEKVFFEYKTRTDEGRKQDAKYITKVNHDLEKLVTVLRLFLDETRFFFTSFDGVLGLRREGCMFVNLICNDTFDYSSADCEAIPVADFDWIIDWIVASDDHALECMAICSWLRKCAVPLQRYNTQEFKDKLKRLCDERGKPWEILDTASSP